MTKEVDLLSPPTNYAVVQLPERKFPGVVVQGDTLNELVKDLGLMAEMLRASRLDELKGEIEYLKETLSEALSHYEQICSVRGIELPYPK
jgi:methyl coenzyme M reductase gamma subunit